MSGKVIRIGVIHVRLLQLIYLTSFINTIKIVIVQYPPVMIMTKNEDGTTSYTGSDFEVLDLFAKNLNIT